MSGYVVFGIILLAVGIISGAVEGFFSISLEAKVPSWLYFASALASVIGLCLVIFNRERIGQCSQCGTETEYTDDEGMFLCSDCELKLLAKKEGPRRCPLDKSRMEKEWVRGVPIDKCPECGGIFLDSGELEEIASEAEADSSGDFAAGFIIGIATG